MAISIDISRLHYPVTALGPGRRVGIWLQGCSIRCQGCISVDTWSSGRGHTTIAAVLEHVRGWLPHADGITISGGEPFDQPDALIDLVGGLRSLITESADILIFSGHSYETIQIYLSKMHGLVDALITDPLDLNSPQTLALRGSDNQRLHLLTDLGRLRFMSFQRQRDLSDSGLDVMFDEYGSVWIAGIPLRDDLTRLRLLLEAQGAIVSTSQHPKSKGASA